MRLAQARPNNRIYCHYCSHNDVDIFGKIIGVSIIGSADISAIDMLIFTVLVIGIVNQGKPIQVLIIVHKKLIAPIIEYVTGPEKTGLIYM